MVCVCLTLPEKYILSMEQDVTISTPNKVINVARGKLITPACLEENAIEPTQVHLTQ